MPNTLIEKLTNIKTAKDNLKTALEGMGLNPGNDFSSYANFAQEQLKPAGSGVKLFPTIDEMNSDPNPHEGDLAVVYRNEVQNATADSKFQVATFPDTVVLDTAITDYVDVRYRAVDNSVMFDCMGSLDSSMFRMDCYTETGEIRIEYESSDGITYTRTDTTGNPVDFGTAIYYAYPEMWNDAIGKFIQCSGDVFEGLYEYKAFNNENKIHAYSYSELSWNNSTRKLTGTGGEIIEFDIEATLNKIKEYTETNFSDYRSLTFYGNPMYEYMLYYYNNCIVFPFVTSNNGSPKFLYNLKLLIDNTTWKATGGIITTGTSNTYNLHEIRVDITTGQLSYELLEEGFINTEYQSLTRFNNYKFVGNINMDGVFNYDSQRNLATIIYYSTKDSTWYASNCIYGEKPGIDDIKYLLAPTQLTSTADNVYIGKFYSKNGVESGTLNNTENLDKKQIAHRVSIWNKFNNIKCPRDMSGAFIDLDIDTIPLIDTSSVENMDNMFQSCYDLVSCPLLDTSNVKSMRYTFNWCTKLATIPQLNTSAVIDMYHTFDRCELTSIPLIDTSNVENMEGCFVLCDLTTIPQFNTSNVKNMKETFRSNLKLTSIPLLDTSNVTTMQSMFEECRSLVDVPMLDTSNVINMQSMFRNCASLETVPVLDTSKVNNMSSMFEACSKLVSCPLLNTSNATTANWMFMNCYVLTTVPVFDLSKVININGMFANCYKLSDESLNNILKMCTNATSYTSTKTLKYIGLSSEQATKCTTLSNYSAFTAAGWTTGY